jgi:hypothetical protein
VEAVNGSAEGSSCLVDEDFGTSEFDERWDDHVARVVFKGIGEWKTVDERQLKLLAGWLTTCTDDPVLLAVCPGNAEALRIRFASAHDMERTREWLEDEGRAIFNDSFGAPSWYGRFDSVRVTGTVHRLLRELAVGVAGQGHWRRL